ncbi:glutathione S-transferase family protein [Sphingorhabdus sp. YGSMI21]|uniref:glutathione S-transferase family protein n=1 Tax=Sphingorhabdus sp. YGSMI21 TaxID=2077182 RepID=UPI000C1E70AA|nr:glutathione S-transferase family protein [Sphingorhabdus sp. YGSMI21]ATW04393.1 glutathione S-transferase [Sphingorhabdus sp. YGSMI21]
MSTISFYTNPMSRGQIARWALHEAGADYEQVLLEYGTSMKAEDYLKINSMGKVPAIEHEGKVVTEGPAICAYLAEAFPDAGLAPAAAERADYYRWLFFAAGPVEAAITNKSLGFEVAQDKEMTAGYGNYDRVVDVLEAKFRADDYVCGSRFTMADVYVGAQVIWGTQFGTLPARDSFVAYAARLTDRAAYNAAKAIDERLIAENG